MSSFSLKPKNRKNPSNCNTQRLNNTFQLHNSSAHKSGSITKKSHNKFVLNSSHNFNFLLSKKDQNLLISQKSKWGHQKKHFPRVPIRSSKNTLKMIQNLESMKIKTESSNDIFYMRNGSPRCNIAYKHDKLFEINPEKNNVKRSSKVIVLKSVSPIISKKSRASRTSVKNIILGNEIDIVLIRISEMNKLDRSTLSGPNGAISESNYN